MWRLSKLDIRGFKSFADASELVFPEGITAVVGPNGCGKSNISDAIVWALGEQSTTLLRAQRMKDVIFQGSAERKPTGTAEVTLHLTTRPQAEQDLFTRSADDRANGDGAKASSTNGAGASHSVGTESSESELAITRRLFRSGDSEYLLNGKKCLLRDVRERLLGTGLGARACYTIGQGRIDQILSASPLERRAPLEEAAGISLYRRRRHGTNLKLEATAQDLARVDDICQEVARQMRSLKRQAGRARRYRGMREQLRSLEETWFTIRLKLAENEAGIAEAALQATNLGEQVARDELEATTGIWSKARNAGRVQRQERDECRQKLYHAQVEHERARSKASRQRDRSAFIGDRQTELERKIRALRVSREEGRSVVKARRSAAGEGDQAARSAEVLLQAAREAFDPIVHLDPELSTFADCIETEPELRAAVVLALGSALRSPILAATQIDNWLEAAETRPGLSVGLRRPGKVMHEMPQADLKLDRLAARVRGRNAIAQAILDDLLANVWLVATSEDALRLSTANVGHGFVDVQGQVWARGAEIRYCNDLNDRVSEEAGAVGDSALFISAAAQAPLPLPEIEILRSQIDQAEQALGVARARALAATRELQVAEAAVRRQDAELTHLQADATALVDSRTAAEATAISADERARDASELCAELAKRLQEDDEVDLTEEFEVSALESVLGAQRSAVERAQARRSANEVHVAEVRIRRNHLHEQVRERLDMEPAELLNHMSAETTGNSGAEVRAGMSNEGALDHEIRQVRNSIERLGPVNLVAYEDYESQKGRFEELNAQRTDLHAATANLREAIKKIDMDCSGRFAEAFEAIDGYFNRIFRQLFGGGRAGMRLECPDEPLSSGIEIMAQPPGKTLQSIRLMSGGERSMIALALMFAIFEYHPSPFCILDEADAALDENNVGRFIQALHHFQDRAQFIMITHNKLSMEVADLLYGVTMEDSGVSKLVSVRLN